MHDRITVLSQRYSRHHYMALSEYAERHGAKLDFAELTPLRETLKAIRGRSLRLLPGIWIRFWKALALLATRGRGTDAAVVALAPYDWRILGATRLRATRTVYFTSWPFWELSDGRVPARRFSRSRLVQRGWERFISNSAAIAAVTPHAAASLTRRFDDATNPVVVGHVVAECFYDACRQHDDRGTGTVLTVLYVGRLEVSKGIDRFIEVASRLHGLNTHFVVVGDGRWTSIVEDAERDGTLRYLGPLPSERLASTMAACDVLVAPGRRTSKWEEVFGMAVAEAAVVGLDVVATDHVGPTWLGQLSPSITIIDDTDDDTIVAALVDQILALRPSPKLGPTGELECFRLEQVQARWSDVIHRAFNQGPPSGE